MARDGGMTARNADEAQLGQRRLFQRDFRASIPHGAFSSRPRGLRHLRAFAGSAHYRRTTPAVKHFPLISI